MIFPDFCLENCFTDGVAHAEGNHCGRRRVSICTFVFEIPLDPYDITKADCYPGVTFSREVKTRDFHMNGESNKGLLDVICDHSVDPEAKG